MGYGQAIFEKMETETIKQRNNAVFLPKLFWEHIRVLEEGQLVVSDEVDAQGQPYVKIRRA